MGPARCTAPRPSRLPARASCSKSSCSVGRASASLHERGDVAVLLEHVHEVRVAQAATPPRSRGTARSASRSTCRGSRGTARSAAAAACRAPTSCAATMCTSALMRCTASTAYIASPRSIAPIRCPSRAGCTLNQSSLAWCTTMNSSSSGCSGSDRGRCSDEQLVEREIRAVARPAVASASGSVRCAQKVDYLERRDVVDAHRLGGEERLAVARANQRAVVRGLVAHDVVQRLAVRVHLAGLRRAVELRPIAADRLELPLELRR